MKIIVGLGNPDKKYFLTRHNIGFQVIDELVNSLNAVKIKSVKNSDLHQAIVNDEKILLAHPLTYMNLSGKAVLELSQFYRVQLKDFLVLVDDIYFPFGMTKLLLQGSDGGHNGLKSIIQMVGKNFPRLRIGIGENIVHNKANLGTDTDRGTEEVAEKKMFRVPLDQYVLSKFSNEEQEQLPKYLSFLKQIVLHTIEKDLHQTMTLFNKRHFSGF